MKDKIEMEQIGNKLIESLTKDQVIQLLDAVFIMLDEKKVNNVLSNVDDDLENTLLELLTPKKSKSKRVISDEKFVEEWKSVCFEWGNIMRFRSRLKEWNDVNRIINSHLKDYLFEGKTNLEKMQNI